MKVCKKEIETTVASLKSFTELPIKESETLIPSQRENHQLPTNEETTLSYSPTPKEFSMSIEKNEQQKERKKHNQIVRNRDFF